MLNIRVNAQHFTADQKLVNYIQKKLSRLERFFQREVQVDVSLKLQDTGGKIHEKITEIRFHSPKGWIIDRKMGNTFEEAINRAVDTLQRQLREQKERVRQRKGRKAQEA